MTTTQRDKKTAKSKPRYFGLMSNFTNRLETKVTELGPLCVGIDPHLHLLPSQMRESWGDLKTSDSRASAAKCVLEWSLMMIEAMRERVAIVKPQVALFEQLGAPGVEALEATCKAASAAGLLVLVDAKRGDIGSTAEAYAKGILDDDGPIGADAVTLSPYLGRDSMEPFINRCRNDGKGVFVLLRTSNPGGAELQTTGVPSPADTVAGWVEGWNREITGGNGLGPVGVVTGATLGDELKIWRERLPSAWFLMPGYGAQGASAEQTRSGFRNDGLGGLVNSSRGVLFPKDHERESYDRDPVAMVAAKIEACRAELNPAF
jgi:orotidine-5'-phosphate decarboxylase